MANEKKFDVISIGNANFDYILHFDKMPKSDQKSIIKTLRTSPGGSACNFAVAAAKLGAKAGFIGHVGKDECGEALLKNFEQNGIDTSRVRTEKGLHTGVSFAFSAPNGKNFVLSYRGANSKLSPEDMDETYLRKARVVHCASVSPDFAINIISLAKKINVRSSLDVGAEFLGIKRQKFLDVVRGVDTCFMNKKFFMDIFELDPTEDGILTVFPDEVGIFIVSLGSGGAILTDGLKTFRVPAFKVHVVDTTGAGDAFAAGFVTRLLQKENLEDALEWGVAVASMKVRASQTQGGLPSQSEVEKFLREEKHRLCEKSLKNLVLGALKTNTSNILMKKKGEGGSV
jgi:ribokinase